MLHKMYKGNFKKAGRGQAKGNTRNHIDVRIKDRRHHQNGPAKRTYFREPVIAGRGPAKDHPKLALYWTGIFKEVGIGIGDERGIRDNG